MTVRTLTYRDHTPARNAGFTDPPATQKDISLRAAHIPDGDLARRAVLKDQIAVAIVVEVARAHHIPSRSARRAKVAQPAAIRQVIPARPVHIPDGNLAGRVVPPHHVHVTVAVEIGGSDHAPAGNAGSAQFAEPA